MSSLAQSDTGVSKPGALSWIALVTVWFLWGSTFLAIRVAVQSIPPFFMVGTRYAVAGALLSAIVWISQGRRRSKITWPELRTVLVSAVLLLVVGNGFLSVSEVHLESGTAALLVATTPLWMIVIDAVLSRSLRALSVAGLILGSLGIFVLVGAPSQHVYLPAAGLVLVGSLSWAIGSVYARRSSAGHLNPLLPALEMLAAGIIMSVIAIFSGEASGVHLAQLPAPALFGWLWLVVAGAMIAYSAYGYAVRTLPTNVVATYAYVNPIVAVILGALMLKEPLTWNVLAGGAGIVLSVITIMIDNRNAAGKPAEESAAQEGEAA